MRPNHLQTYLQHALTMGEPVCVKGRPGVGKTDIISAAAESLGYDLLITHPTVDDPIDYKGLPAVVNDAAEFLPYGNLRAMLQAERPLVVFFDDLGQAAEAVQKALMQLLLSRSLNGQKISRHVRFVAATNQKEDKAGVSGLLEPVKSRFGGIVDLDVHVDDWKQWAISHNLPTNVIAFVDFKPESITDWKPTKDMVNSPCPRTLAKLAKWVQAELPEDIRVDAYQGAIGNMGHEFRAFERMADALPDAHEILANPKSAPLPDSQRPDVCIATASMLAQHVESYNAGALFTYLERFDKAQLVEYAVVCVKNVRMREKASDDLRLTYGPEAMKWLAGHKDMTL